MSLKKTLLAASIGSLLFATSAQADVVLGTGTPLNVAIEIVNGTTLDELDGSDANDITWTVGYNFSENEVRYGSLKCSSNIQLDPTDLTVNAGADANNILVGAINGAGTDTLFFSMTGEAGTINGVGDQATADIGITVDVDATLLDKEDVTCEFAIYDTPSQAQSGGSTGRIFTTGAQPYINRLHSYEFAVIAGMNTADVEAVEAYTDFVDPLDQTFVNAMAVDLRSPLPVNIDLDPITLDDLFTNAGDTYVTVSGDFSAANDILWGGSSADGRTAGVATFEYGAGASWGTLPYDGAVDYDPTGTDEIQISSYTARFYPDFETGYELMQTHSQIAAGDIDRNGTELLAPLAQVPAGWRSRVALHNTGSVTREFTVTLIPADGTTYVGTTTFNGTVDGGATVVLDVADMFPQVDFTAGAPRGTIKVTAEAPRSQMNGLYQLANPTSGSVTNHIMVAPGTN